MKHMSTKKMRCSKCKHPHLILLKEYTRAQKNNQTNFFCSRSCSTSYRNKHLSPEQKADAIRNLTPQWGNQYNKKGDFTYFLRRARSRKYLETDIDEIFLSELWKRQDGKCAISGLPIQLPKDTVNSTKIRSLTTASLDRIDSTKGYIKGNVQFLAFAINLGKNHHSDSDMREFVAAIRRS